MTTAPIILKVGDGVYWRYSGDLVRFAKILGIILPPNLLQREPIYSIEMQNGQTHSARHDELFITKNKALSLDQNGVIRSNKSITTASDQLDLTAIGESYTPIITQQWANLNPEKFKKLPTPQTNIKEYKLADDSIVYMKCLMDFLSSSITGASTTGLLRLPAIMDLSPVITIRDLWLPPPSHPKYPIAKACYSNIVSAILVLLTSEDFAKDAPKAKLAISAVCWTMFPRLCVRSFLPLNVN
jgi:hypothetical protein